MLVNAPTAGPVALVLGDVESHGSVNNAILDLQGSDCELIRHISVSAGQTVIVTLAGGDSLAVTATEVVLGSTFAKKYANLEVRPNGCAVDAGCSLGFGTILDCGDHVREIVNVGESIVANVQPSSITLAVHLDDLEAHGDVVAAIVSIWDQMCNIVRRQVIQEGQTVVLTYSGQSLSVTANRIAPGYTGSTRWADLTVTNACTPDAGTSSDAGSD